MFFFSKQSPSQVVLVVKNPPPNASHIRDGGFDPWVGNIPWIREATHSSILAWGESHGQRGLVGCSPWGRKDLDTTERMHTHRSLETHLQTLKKNKNYLVFQISQPGTAGRKMTYGKTNACWKSQVSVQALPAAPLDHTRYLQHTRHSFRHLDTTKHKNG